VYATAGHPFGKSAKLRPCIPALGSLSNTVISQLARTSPTGQAAKMATEAAHQPTRRLVAQRRCLTGLFRWFLIAFLCLARDNAVCAIIPPRGTARVGGVQS
jgi:hypothetical protein